MRRCQLRVSIRFLKTKSTTRRPILKLPTSKTQQLPNKPLSSTTRPSTSRSETACFSETLRVLTLESCTQSKSLHHQLSRMQKNRSLGTVKTISSLKTRMKSLVLPPLKNRWRLNRALWLALTLRSHTSTTMEYIRIRLAYQSEPLVPRSTQPVTSSKLKSTIISCSWLSKMNYPVFRS